MVVISVSWKEFQTIDGECRQHTHSQDTTAQYSLITARTAHSMRLAQDQAWFAGIFVHQHKSCHLVCRLSHPWLFSHAPSSTSTFLFFTLPVLPHTQNTQYIPNVSKIAVDKLRHQESLWREDLQSGGNPRTTTPTQAMSSSFCSHRSQAFGWDVTHSDKQLESWEVGQSAVSKNQRAYWGWIFSNFHRDSNSHNHTEPEVREVRDTAGWCRAVNQTSAPGPRESQQASSDLQIPKPARQLSPAEREDSIQKRQRPAEGEHGDDDSRSLQRKRKRILDRRSESTAHRRTESQHGIIWCGGGGRQTNKFSRHAGYQKQRLDGTRIWADCQEVAFQEPLPTSSSARLATDSSMVIPGPQRPKNSTTAISRRKRGQYPKTSETIRGEHSVSPCRWW